MNSAPLHTVFLGLGSNLGDRASHLEKARNAIQQAGNMIVSISGIYESLPWGFESVHDFYNQCIGVNSILEPEGFLLLIQNIEQTIGRKQSGNTYQDRLIDIDILLWEDLVIESVDLKIPHPFMHLREFVLLPLNEIASKVRHPVLQKTVSELLEICPDKGGVRPLRR